MIKVTWKFTKEYTEEQFQKAFSEQNDVQYEGYFVIARDFENIDCSDDMNLDFEIEHV